ncbi:hypothetical protein LXA43DRAFT_1038881 [Ganoderma leucocontextum]|nr:hypothetical protein LXA43DRAFT_1038881 [Ganoderma leucocontextum]
MPSMTSSYLLRQFITTPRRCSRDSASVSLRSWSSDASRNSTTSRPAFCLRRSTSAPIPHRFGPSHLSSLRNTRRTFVSTSSTRAAVAQRPPSHRTQLVSYPSPSETREEDEDEDEPDVEFVPPEEAVLEMTDRAAEQLRSIARRENNEASALRIAVESGGCHGYQYKMELAKKREPDDYHFAHPQIQPSNIYVDAVSMTLLKGSTIDFATELIGSSFRIVENPQAKGSGCGCGVSWELKL